MKQLSHLALEWCIPLLVASSILLQQQQEGQEYLWWAGQILSIAGAISSIIIVYCWPMHRGITLSLIIGVIGLRLTRLLLPDDTSLFLLYEVVLLGLMAAVGYVIAHRNPFLVEKQLVAICLLGLPVMLLQMLGIAEWSQLLRTDFHDAGLNDLTQYPTLLIPYDELETCSTIQLRPSGLFASNNALSLVLAMAAGLRMSRFTSGSLNWHDFLLALACTLAMSKTVFGVIGCVGLLILFFGNNVGRKFIIYFMLIIAACLLGYFIIFPGLWANNVDSELWILNFSLRAIGIEQALNIDLIGDELRNQAWSQRPLLFDESGNLINPEGSLALIATHWGQYLTAILLTIGAIMLYYLKKARDYAPLMPLFIHVIVIAICLFGLGMATSAIFAVYFGIVVADMMKIKTS